MEKTFPHRRFKLRIWWLALGYFIFYAPYSFLIKVVTTKPWPGIDGAISGFRLLPAVVLSTAVVLLVFVSLKGWWKYAGRRKILGLSLPFPSSLVVLSGLGTAIIIATTTIAFTFTGVSILFALLLMRGGVLIIAPAVDLLFRRRVRWFSWTALALTVPALLIALTDVNNYQLTVVVVLTIAAYLSGYLLRLPCVTKLAKIEDRVISRGYFVEEMMVALFFLVAIPAVFAFVGEGETMMELRHGFTGLLVSGVTLPAILIGALYAGLYCFGTLIYLDSRENTFCIPLNRGFSLLAGVAASYGLAWSFGQQLPGGAQLGSAGLILVALLFLSPLHHFQRALDRLRLSVTGTFEMLLNIALRWRSPIYPAGDQPVAAANYLTTPNLNGQRPEKPPRIFLFVCSGNTCRSPIAAAISNAEIATRLKIPFTALETVNVQALSAGLSANVGAPMTPEATEVLRSLNVPVGRHAARNLTVGLAEQAERIFCMTSAHRKAVIKMIPSVAWKTYCLDHEGDIGDPIGKGREAYLNCALRIRSLMRLRFDELGLQGGPQK